MDLKTLCETYSPYNHRERMNAIFRDFDRVLITSSFGATSATFLHLLHKTRPEHPVYFIDTKYHFTETIKYKHELEKMLKLDIRAVAPKSNENAYTQMDYTWSYEPDACCYVNKVLPVEALTASHDVWVSGMIGASETRRNQPLFQMKGGILRFYPLIDMTEEEAHYYRIAYDLPEHPLESEGYSSIGCTHCTKPGASRSGRWAGFNKTECGLHL
ncbi:MAG: phosphoadenylyl-sulfate reductase [Bacteroidia bacterium]|nr:phosphoadenylyl-sulfate reductase [Bacteroidia bacterium]